MGVLSPDLATIPRLGTSMRQRLLRFVFTLPALLVALTVRAQTPGFNAQRFEPAAGAAGGLVVERPLVPMSLGWGVGLYLNYESSALVVRNGTDVLSKPLADGVSADLLASIGLFNIAEIALDVPLELVYRGDSINVGGTTFTAGPGIGDIRLVPKIAFGGGGSGRTGDISPWRFGLAVPIGFPTGSGPALRGEGGVSVNPELLLGLRFARVGLNLNAGFKARPNASTTEMAGNGITAGLSATVALLPHRDVLDLLLELVGEKYLSPARPGLDSLPIEAMAALGINPHPGWTVHVGGGAGLTSGLGDPTFRVLAGVRYTPRPSSDYADSDNDGIPDAYDRCPNQAEDFDGFQDEDGCPDYDNDHDGVPDDRDECPDVAEGPGGTGDGCPVDPVVVYREGRILVIGKIHFASGSDRVLPRSERTLDRLAGLLREHPEIRHVRVEGHTDDIGGTELNLRLSRERSERVRKELEGRGVRGSRLSAKGFGEARPVAPNGTKAGRAKNRRVEFTIL